MFGLFQKKPHVLGTYSFKVFQGEGSEVSISYQGQKLNKTDSLFLRGLYAAETMYTASDAEVSALILLMIAGGCVHLSEGKGTDTASVADVQLVPDGRSLVKRYTEHSIRVAKKSQTDLPMMQTVRPKETTYGDMIAAVAAFNESWLSEHGVELDDLAVKSYLQFFGGFFNYYDEDPIAFRDPQSVFQAPMKAYIFANSNVVGLMGLADDQ